MKDFFKKLMIPFAFLFVMFMLFLGYCEQKIQKWKNK